MNRASTATIPPFPRITVELGADNSGRVSIQGVVHAVPATGETAAARLAALAVVTLHAAGPLGRPVRVSAAEADGTTWPLVVYPTGHVEAGEVATVGASPRALTVQVVAPDGSTSTAARAVLVGRDPAPLADEAPAVTFAVPDPERSVSRTHARLDVDERGQVLLTDRHSANGTVLELHGARRRVPAGRAVVVPVGASVQVGAVPLLVERAHG